MTLRFLRLAGLLTLSLTVLLGSARVARADASDAAAAQALFDQARQLMSKGQFKAACPKLKESQRLDPGSGTLINLADCYDHEGKTASAWSTFLEAAAASRRIGNPEREQAARTRAKVLEAKLPKLVVNVAAPSRVPGLELTRDGGVIRQPLWGTAVPTDPGKHTIIAKAPGYKPWQFIAEVKPGATTATVDVPPLQQESAQATSAPSPAASTAPGAPPKDQAPSGSKGGGLGTQRTLALVSGGVGVVGVALGTVFGLKAKSKHDEAASHCDGSVCRDQTGVDLKSQARSAGNISTVGFIVGGVGLAAGATLWFTAGPKHTEVGLTPSGVSVRGVW